MARLARRRGARKRSLVVGGGFALALLILVLVLPAVPSVRSFALRQAITRVDRVWPGHWSVDRPMWPRLDEIDLAGFRWIDGADTLLAVDRARVRLHLGALAHGDVHVAHLTIEGLRADVATARDVLVGRREPSPDSSTPRFPRTGSLSPLPSVAVDSFRVDAPSLRFSRDVPPSAVTLAGELDLRRGHEPRLTLHEFRVDHPAADLTLGPGSLELSPGRGHGTIPGLWRGSWPFAVTADSDEEDRIRLVIADMSPDAHGAAVRIVAQTHRSGVQLQWVDVTADIRSPRVGRLASLPAVAPHVRALSPTEQLVMRLDGNVFFRPRSESRFRAELRSPFADVDTLSFDLHVSPGEIEVSSVRLVGGGLAAQGSWHRMDGVDRLEAEAAATGTEWLANFAPSAPRPDSVALSVVARAEGPVGALDGHVTIEGAMRRGAARMDSLDATLDGALTGPAPLTFDVALHSGGHWLTGAGEIASRNPLRVTTSTWTVSPERRTPPSERPVTFARGERDSSLRLEGFELLGALGDVRADGEWNPATGAQGTLSGRWPRSPGPLLHALGPERAARAAAAWPVDVPPFMKLRASWDPAGTWSAGGEFRLPGPALGAAILASKAEVRDLDTVSGTMSMSGQGRDFTLTLDAGRTDWIDTLRLAARRSNGTTLVDSLRLVVEGLALEAAGQRNADGAARADGRIDLEGTALLRRFASDLPESLSLRAAADLHLDGPLDAPDGTADLALTASTPQWELPGSLTHLDVGAGAVRRIVARTVDTLRVGGRTFHEVEIEVRPLPTRAGTSLLPLLASVHAEGDELGAAAVASFEREADGAGAWVAQADTLALRFRGRGLSSPTASAFRWDPDRRQLTVTALRLDGSAGSVSAGGTLGADSCDFEARWELPSIADWLGEGAAPTALQGLDSLAGTLRVVRRDSVDLDATAGGILLGATGRHATRLRASTGGDGTRGRVTLGDADRRVLEADVTLPFRLDVLSPQLVDTGGAWKVDLVASGLPLPLRAGVPSEVEAFLDGEAVPSARLEGRASLSGGPGPVTGSANFIASFPDVPRLGRERIHVEADLAPPAPPEDGTPPGLRARAEWSGERSGAAHVDLALPGLVVASRGAGTTPGDSLSLHLVVKGWTLDDVNAFLPPDTRLGGRLDTDLRVEGSPRAPALSGWFETKDLTATTAKGDRARAAGRLEFAGTTEAPRVDGRLQVTQALLFVPDPPRALHDTHGSALLWSDSTFAGSAPPAPPPEPAAVAAAEALDLGIDVSIPGAFWIRGRGLNVEMAGELALVFRDRKPTVRGELRAVRGSLTFVGQRFTVERGTATFFGDDEIDPDLDIELSQRRGDVRAIVHVTGKASSPRIELTSEPPMEEADILSHLVFHRSSSELDREQTGFLQSQVTSALEMYAIPGLENELGRRIGLDLVQVRRREDEREDLSIVVGKYLSPRALLKYDQGLDRGSDFTINLEYWLSHHVRLETTSSRQEASGIEVNWSSDY